MAGTNGFEGERRHVKTRIPAHISQIREARRFVEQVISEGALSDERAFDLEVAVSEACASAIERSKQKVELAAWRLPDRVVVEISSQAGPGFSRAEADEQKLPLSLPLMTSLADQVQISRLSDHLTRVSLTFLIDSACSRLDESIDPSDEAGEESERKRLLEDPRVRGHVLTDAESLERKAAEARLMRQAFRDPLTGLANRALFFDRLANALTRADRRGSSVALVLIDLDDFKKVNDSWGVTPGATGCSSNWPSGLAASSGRRTRRLALAGRARAGPRGGDGCGSMRPAASRAAHRRCADDHLNRFQAGARETGSRYQRGCLCGKRRKGAPESRGDKKGRSAPRRRRLRYRVLVFESIEQTPCRFP